MMKIGGIGMNQAFSDKESVQSLVVEALEAWNRKDAKAFSEYFIEDAEFTDVVGPLMPRSSEIERLHIPPLSTVLKKAHLQVQELRIKAIRHDVVSVDVRWETTGHTKPDGTPLPPRHGLLHLIVIESEKKWKITIAHNADYTATFGFQDAAKVVQRSI